MRNYGNQNLEVVRAARTGSFMIRIDHLIPPMFYDSSNTDMMTKELYHVEDEKHTMKHTCQT